MKQLKPEVSVQFQKFIPAILTGASNRRGPKEIGEARPERQRGDAIPETRRARVFYETNVYFASAIKGGLEVGASVDGTADRLAVRDTLPALRPRLRGYSRRVNSLRNNRTLRGEVVERTLTREWMALAAGPADGRASFN